MKYKIFILSFFILLIIVGILVPIVNYSFYRTPFGASLWINNSYLKKESYAQNITGQKIIFVSGSNTLFGIEAHLLEEWLKIPVVNMGMHAGLRTDYPLYRVKRFVQKNDIVILPFEFESYVWDGDQNDTEKRDLILTYDREFFNNHLDLFQKISMLHTITPMDSLITFAKLIRMWIYRIPIQEDGSGYLSKTQNKNGDETKKSGSTEGFQQLVLKPNITIASAQTQGIRDIIAFANWCKERGVYVFVTFPNTVDFEVYHHEPYTEYFHRLITQFNDANIDVIGNPTDFFYPKAYFYDTMYHLNNKGSKIRTHDFLRHFATSIKDIPSLKTIYENAQYTINHQTISPM